MAKISFSKAVRQALEGEMLRDESIFVAGEDVTWGGTMKLYYGLADKFPDRILDTPISETSIAGLGLGAAIMGMHPLIDFNIMDFTLCAFDEIANGIAKYRFMTDGKLSVPLVIHVASGAIPGAGPQHAQSLEALYAHIPGLKVVFPSNPADGAGLMRTVLRDPDPVVFIDSMQLVGVKGDVPEGDYVVPLGSARLCRQGDDVTVITYGSTVPVAESAAERLMDLGVSADVIDLRSLVPLDMETVLGSVRKTGRALVVHEAVRSGGFGAEVAARIAEEGFDMLKAPIVRLGAAFQPIPFAPILKERYYVGIDDVVKAALQLVDRS
jgi:pyruvate dehydrogenase E1 component beta subunit